MSSSILFFTSLFGATVGGARSKDVMLSRNSREAISWMKWAPPFLTHESVSYAMLVVSDVDDDVDVDVVLRSVSRTFRVASWILGFLFPIRFFNARIASLGCTVLERITSDISRLRGMSSLQRVSNGS